MSEEKENSIFKIDDESSAQNTTITESIDMDEGFSNASKRNDIGDNRSASTEFKEITELNTSSCEIINKTQATNSVKFESECTPTDFDVALAIENIGNKISGNQTVVERYFNSLENNLCKRSLSRQSEENIQPSNELLHTESSSESSSCEWTETEDTEEDRFKFKNPFEMVQLPKVLSDCYTSSTSTDTCTVSSSTCSDDTLADCSVYEGTAKNTRSPLDCTGALAAERFSSESPWVNANVFFYSSTTRRIRENYDKLFDFDEFRYASSLGVNTYKYILNIKYITLSISRFLLEDLLDFVDFLNGTEVELREQNSNMWLATSEERQLAFVRENFALGVMQHEFRTLYSLFKECEISLWEKTLATGDNSNPKEILDAQFLLFYGVGVKTEKVNFETESSSHSSKLSNTPYSLFILEKCRLRELDPNIEQMPWDSITDYLEYLNEAIGRSVMHCISDIKMILDICIESKLNINELRLKSYLSGIKCMLNRLFVLREDCVLLLRECDDPIEKVNVMNILKVKVQIATVFLELLSKLLEVNSDFLGSVHI